MLREILDATWQVIGISLGAVIIYALIKGVINHIKSNKRDD